jgi:hypothetical protein
MDAATTQPPTAPLDYASAPSKRRKWLRRAVAFVFVISSAFAAWRWGPTAWEQGKFRYWKYRCQTYTAAPDVICYEEDPGNAAKLLASRPQYHPQSAVVPNKHGTYDHVTLACLIPDCWRHFFIDSGMARVIEGTGWPADLPVVFLHDRTDPSGQHHLVCVRFCYAMTLSFCTQCGVFGPGKIQFHAVYFRMGTPVPPQLLQLRIYAGQIDPNDDSHFTIRYEIWGQEDVIDGYLRNDYQVTLTQRNAPKPPHQLPAGR